MGRALIAVAALLVLCFVVLGGVVYFTRSEDKVAVSNVLAEDLARAITLADNERDPVVLTDLTGFDWDRVLLVAKGTPADDISAALGTEFKGELLYTAESKDLLVFARGRTLAAFADYRGLGRFEDVERPIDEFTPETAVFRVRDLVITPAA